VDLNCLLEKTAKTIFFNMHLNRWAFDVEMFYIGKHLNIPVIETPVNWKEIDGSKLNVSTASISFVRDFCSLIAFYNVGWWKLPIINN